MDFTPSQCRACKRKQPEKLACEAYPAGIPDAMLFGGGDHRQPRPGDGGRTFLLAPGPEAAQEFGYWEQVYGA
jgi:hypothetical protein